MIQNSFKHRIAIKFGFFEKLAILFGKEVVVDTLFVTDTPFNTANAASIAGVESSTSMESFKSVPDWTQINIPTPELPTPEQGEKDECNSRPTEG